MLHILHCITSLDPDGAQRMLLRLCVGLNKKKFKNTIVSLTPLSEFAQEFQKAGFDVISLNMKAGIPSPLALVKLRRIITKTKPDLIQSWMYHANIICSLTKKLFFLNTPLLWNIRCALHNQDDLPLKTKIIVRLSALLSKNPSKIIFNSKSSILQHERVGFNKSNFLYLANGFETDKFAPNNHVYEKTRNDWGLSEAQMLIGIAGRYNPDKDFPSFLKAFSIALKEFPNLKAVLIGRKVAKDNPELMELITNLNIENSLYLLGQQDNIEAILPALDIFCSTSVTEGFPNVVAEAMSCGVPCVVTDVGLSATLVEGCGISVPAKNPDIFGAELIKILELPEEKRKSLGVASREKIIKDYSLEKIVEDYAKLYDESIIKN